MSDDKNPSQVTKGRILTVQVEPMPSDASIENRIISAGWLMSEMDKAAGWRADEYIYQGEPASNGRAVTVGIDAMAFKKPAYARDLVQIFTEVARQGRSSLTIKTEAWVTHRKDRIVEKMAEGLITFVAVDATGKSMEIKTNSDLQSQASSASVAGRKGPDSQAAVIVPRGDLILHRKPTKKDRNPKGDIFGGWTLSRMDDACIQAAVRHTGNKVATIALDTMKFHKPLYPGENVNIYTEIMRTGATSIAINVEAWAQRKGGRQEKITDGLFTYVAVDKNFKPVVFSGP
ncbi:MAG TPA: hotdog domain-containing protein [Micavibrio sp.]|jgi:acyl-CoA thioesterase YciA